MLTLFSRPALSQERTRGALVPSVAFGVFEQIGPHVQVGLQLQRSLSERFTGTIQAAGWQSIATTFEEASGRDRPSNGTSVDMGIDAQTNRRGTLRPYVGVGAGAISIREWLPTVNTRVGLAMGARRGAQLRLEFRTLAKPRT